MTPAGFGASETEREEAPAELYTEPRWYACYTRARHEKRVDGYLTRNGVESYLPMVPRLRQWKDRKKWVNWPMFPSYVFARFTLGRMHDILVVPGVSTIVRTHGYPAPIPEEELQNLRRFADAALAAGVCPDPVPLVAEGDWVRITDGAFRGVEGRVVERRGRRRVLVGLRPIGRGLEVDVEARLLQVIPAPSWSKA